MAFAQPPHTPVRRALFRAPIWMYRLGLGGLLAHRFVLLTHRGRKSGQPRHAVLEIVGYDEESGEYRIASGYGARSQWFRNIQAEPRVLFEVGWRRFRGTAVPLPPQESGRALAEYARRHPRIASALLSRLDDEIDGSDAAYERIGADAENGIPIIALRPDP